MRVAQFLLLALLPVHLFSQTAGARFIEVQVSDSVRLPFEGMDIEVRMDDPVQLATNDASASEEADTDYEKALNKAEATAKANEARYLGMLKENNFAYQLGSTEHTQDYSGRSERKFDVNSYIIKLKPAEMEHYYKLCEGQIGWIGSPKEPHFGNASAASPRLMKKLYDQAVLKAQALAALTGGRIGKVISAQELPKTEGSILEQLFKLDKQHDKDDALMQMGSTSSAVIAFRFELLDRP